MDVVTRRRPCRSSEPTIPAVRGTEQGTDAAGRGEGKLQSSEWVQSSEQVYGSPFISDVTKAPRD